MQLEENWGNLPVLYHFYVRTTQGGPPPPPATCAEHVQYHTPLAQNSLVILARFSLSLRTADWILFHVPVDGNYPPHTERLCTTSVKRLAHSVFHCVVLYHLILHNFFYPPLIQLHGLFISRLSSSFILCVQFVLQNFFMGTLSSNQWEPYPPLRRPKIPSGIFGLFSKLFEPKSISTIPSNLPVL